MTRYCEISQNFSIIFQTSCLLLKQHEVSLDSWNKKPGWAIMRDFTWFYWILEKNTYRPLFISSRPFWILSAILDFVGRFGLCLERGSQIEIKPFGSKFHSFSVSVSGIIHFQVLYPEDPVFEIFWDIAVFNPANLLMLFQRDFFLALTPRYSHTIGWIA